MQYAFILISEMKLPSWAQDAAANMESPQVHNENVGKKRKLVKCGWTKLVEG